MWWNYTFVWKCNWSTWELETKRLLILMCVNLSPLIKMIKMRYSREYKLEVVRFYLENNLYKTAKRFCLNMKMIGHWVADMMAMHEWYFYLKILSFGLALPVILLLISVLSEHIVNYLVSYVTIASFPSAWGRGDKSAWYTLFAHVYNYSEFWKHRIL